jgi:hypothetical protein
MPQTGKSRVNPGRAAGDFDEPFGTMGNRIVTQNPQLIRNLGGTASRSKIGHFDHLRPKTGRIVGSTMAGGDRRVGLWSPDR